MEEKKEKVKSKQRRPKKSEEENRTVRASQLIKRSVETSRYFTPYVLPSFSFFFFLIYPLATKVLVRDRDNRKSTATAFMFLISFHRVYFSSIVRKSEAFHDQREIKKETFLFCASHDCLLPLVTRGSFEIFLNIRNWFSFARLRTLCRIFA